jgi:hypothetical protein
VADSASPSGIGLNMVIPANISPRLESCGAIC